MLVHHSSSQSYNEAAAHARTIALPKLEALIESGRERAAAVIAKVQNEVPVDFVAQSERMIFEARDNGVVLAHTDVPELRLHRNAMRQAAGRGDIPLAYLDRLADDKQFDALAYNLNKRVGHEATQQGKTRFLLRTISGEARGFLSDKYRRLDTRPQLQMFLEAMQNLGALPFEGFALDTKISIRAVLPRIFEPVPNEIMVFGAAYENSDFGNGAVSMRLFVNRLWCTNTAVMEEALRQIHLGKRLSDDIRFSDRTYQLDSETVASALKDTVNRVLGSDTINAYLEGIKIAAQEKLEPAAAKAMLAKLLTKAETERVVEAYNSPDVEMMPAGNTKWRLSNAVSFIANKTEDEERRIDLSKIAGSFLSSKLTTAPTHVAAA